MRSPDQPRVAVVGAGRAGLAVALGLSSGPGACDVTLVCRSADRRAQIQRHTLPETLTIIQTPSQAQTLADIVAFATADRDLTKAATQWENSRAASDRQVWLHLSGAASPEVLRSGSVAAAVGSCHPLAAIPDPLVAARNTGDLVAAATAPLDGAFFALAGDDSALPHAHWLATALGGSPHVVPLGRRMAYHGAAAVVANDLVALLAIGERLCAQCELPSAVARPALVHLARTALDAVTAASLAPGASLADGLTGAVGRGDAATLTGHLEALSGGGRDVHRQLSMILLELVMDVGGLSQEQATHVRRALDSRD
ncbi:MAG: DUF2520 domain-containing protein [Myxococcales bacterium]|nr:DUF2520 domain-containing protein [Myxococcales bacterium]